MARGAVALEMNAATFEIGWANLPLDSAPGQQRQQQKAHEGGDVMNPGRNHVCRILSQ